MTKTGRIVTQPEIQRLPPKSDDARILADAILKKRYDERVENLLKDVGYGSLERRIMDKFR
jgi:hypothetical protein